MSQLLIKPGNAPPVIPAGEELQATIAAATERRGEGYKHDVHIKPSHLGFVGVSLAGRLDGGPDRPAMPSTRQWLTAGDRSNSGMSDVGNTAAATVLTRASSLQPSGHASAMAPMTVPAQSAAAAEQRLGGRNTSTYLTAFAPVIPTLRGVTLDQASSGTPSQAVISQPPAMQAVLTGQLPAPTPAEPPAVTSMQASAPGTAAQAPARAAPAARATPAKPASSPAAAAPQASAGASSPAKKSRAKAADSSSSTPTPAPVPAAGKKRSRAAAASSSSALAATGFAAAKWTSELEFIAAPLESVADLCPPGITLHHILPADLCAADALALGTVQLPGSIAWPAHLAIEWLSQYATLISAVPICRSVQPDHTQGWLLLVACAPGQLDSVQPVARPSPCRYLWAVLDLRPALQGFVQGKPVCSTVPLHTTAWHAQWQSALALLHTQRSVAEPGSESLPRVVCTCSKQLLYPLLQVHARIPLAHPGTGVVTHSPSTALPCELRALTEDLSLMGLLVSKSSMHAKAEFAVASLVETLGEDAKLAAGVAGCASHTAIQLQGEATAAVRVPATSTCPSPAARALDQLLLWRSLQDQVQSLAARSALELQEAPIAHMLASIEVGGLGCHVQALQTIQPVLMKHLDQLKTEAARLAGHEFLVTSALQLSKVLYDELKLVAEEREKAWTSRSATTKRCRSTAKEVLWQMVPQHELPGLVLAFRRLNYVKSHYLQGLANAACAVDTTAAVAAAASVRARSTAPPSLQWSGAGPMCVVSTELAADPARFTAHRVHCQLLQVITGTGRLSCAHPNMQNLPKKDLAQHDWPSEEHLVSAVKKHMAGLNVNVRNAIIPTAQGHILLTLDYSQIEMRVLAHCSGDAELISLFEHGQDVYRSLASQVNSIPVAEVSDAQRDAAKTITLALMYGMGTASLAEKLGTDEAFAVDAKTKFMARFPGVAKLVALATTFAGEQGWVPTLAGRRRYLTLVGSADDEQAAYAQRQAVNSIIQGSAADLMKQAMLAVQARMRAAVQAVSSAARASAPADADIALSRCSVLLQVHDELLLQCPKDPGTARAALSELKRVMEHDVQPLLAQLQATVHMDDAYGADMARLLGKTKADEPGLPVFTVPLGVHTSIGKRWGEMVSWEA